MTDELPRRRADLDVEVDSEEARLADPATGEVHVLNASAFAIWELCDGRTDLAAMAEAVSEVTRIDRAEAAAQIRQTVVLLREKGLVE